MDEIFWAFSIITEPFVTVLRSEFLETSVYKGYKQDKIEMRGDRAEMSDFPLYLNTVAGGLDRRDQTIGGFSFVCVQQSWTTLAGVSPVTVIASEPCS